MGLWAGARQDFVPPILERVKKEYIVGTYGIESWTEPVEFLEQLARKTGKLGKVRVCSMHSTLHGSPGAQCVLLCPLLALGCPADHRCLLHCPRVFVSHSNDVHRVVSRRLTYALAC